MTNSLSVFSSVLLFLESFCGCFGTFSGTERHSLVKLESVVKVLPALVQPFFVLCTQSSSIKRHVPNT